MLLGALASLDYVRRRRDGALPPDAQRAALAGRASPTARSPALVGDFTYDAWDHMAALERVLEGGDPVGLHERDPDDPYWERYQRAMYEMAGDVGRPASRARCRCGARSGCSTWPAAAAATPRRSAAATRTCTRRSPSSRAPARLGRKRIERAGLADRIDYRVGDLFEGDLGHGLRRRHRPHGPAQPDARALRRAAAARPRRGPPRRPGRRPRHGPRAGTRVAALGALLFHVLEPGTRTWTAAELTGYVRAAGLTRVRVKRLPRLPGTVLLLAERPA